MAFRRMQSKVNKFISRIRAREWQREELHKFFLPKNNENTGKMIQINLRALTIGWKLTTIWRLFIQEKLLDLSKDDRFCGVLYDLLTPILKKPRDQRIVFICQLLGKVQFTGLVLFGLNQSLFSEKNSILGVFVKNNQQKWFNITAA